MFGTFLGRLGDPAQAQFDPRFEFMRLVNDMPLRRLLRWQRGSGAWRLGQYDPELLYALGA